MGPQFHRLRLRVTRNRSELLVLVAPGRAQKHFHTASPEGAAV